MSLNAEQAKLRLTLPTQQNPAEIKILFRDVYERLEEALKQIELLNNEIRKISENRPRTGKDSGRNLHTS